MFRINDVYKLQDTSFRILKMTLYHIVNGILKLTPFTLQMAK